LQPGCEIRRFAHHSLLLRSALTDEIPHDDEPRSDSKPHCKCLWTAAGRHRQARYRGDDLEPRAYGAFGVVLVSARKTEKSKNAIADIARNGSLVAANDGTARGLIGQYDIAQFLGVEETCKSARPHQIAEQDRELTAFRLRALRSTLVCRRLRGSAFQWRTAPATEAEFERIYEPTARTSSVFQRKGMLWFAVVRWARWAWQA
jgi:hypothetical protein